MIEVLPVAQSGGERGRGYDGILLCAPHAAYGTSDDLEGFVDAAHGFALSVVLDIVRPGKTIFAWPIGTNDLPQNPIIVRLASGVAE